MIRLLISLAAFLAAAAPNATASSTSDIWRRKPAGLVGGWDFSGGRTFSPDGTSLTLFGNAALSSGTRYLSLDGSGDYCTWTSTASQTFSVSVWVYKTTTNTEVWIQHGRVSGYSATLSGLRIVTGSAFSFTDIQGSGTSLVGPCYAAAPSLNAWTHYVSTFDAGTLRIYQDGSLRSTVSGSNYTMVSGSSQLGRQADTGGHFYATGRVGTLLPFNVVLSPESVARLHNTGRSRIAAGGTP